MWDDAEDDAERDEGTGDRRRGRGSDKFGGGEWAAWGEALSSFGPPQPGRRGPRPGRGPGRGSGRHGGRHGQPVPPWMAALLGFDAPTERPRPSGPRVRRGDVRAAILDVLAAEPRNGYQIINEIAERSHGEWKPSPGSVYPTIQQLEDEGLVAADEPMGRRTLSLTPEGQEYVATHADELAAVWRPFAPPEPDPQGALPEIGQVMSALWQIVATGTDAQRKQALEVLADARRRLYGILAEGDK